MRALIVTLLVLSLFTVSGCSFRVRNEVRFVTFSPKWVPPTPQALIDQQKTRPAGFDTEVSCRHYGVVAGSINADETPSSSTRRATSKFYTYGKISDGWLYLPLGEPYKSFDSIAYRKRYQLRGHILKDGTVNPQSMQLIIEASEDEPWDQGALFAVRFRTKGK